MINIIDNFNPNKDKENSGLQKLEETNDINCEKPEDIVNHILIDENWRNILLRNKMKYMGVACGILPSSIICSVIDIVQDFAPYKLINKKNRIIFVIFYYFFINCNIITNYNQAIKKEV